MPRLWFRLVRGRPSVAPWLEALAAGFTAYGVSSFLALHEPTSYYGDMFSEMSKDPFHSKSPLGYRYLVPTLAWALRLDMGGYYRLTDLSSVAFCCLIFRWARNFYGVRSVAWLLTLALAFLQPVEFNHIAPGWSDSFAYVWLLCAMIWPRLRGLWVFLGLSTHEFFAIYLPWIYAYERTLVTADRETPRSHAARFGRDVAIGVIAYTLIRWTLATSNQHAIEFSLHHYLSQLLAEPLLEWNAQPIVLGLVVSLKCFWVLLSVALTRTTLGKEKNPLGAALIGLPVAGALSLVLVAHDTSRLLGNAFPAILILPWVWPRSRPWLPLVIAVNLLIPSFYFGSDWYRPMSRYAEVFDPLVRKYLYRPWGEPRKGFYYGPAWRNDPLRPGPNDPPTSLLLP